MEEYFGRYRNVLDAKGRVNMPARFREMTDAQAEGNQIFILTRGTEKYVAMFPIGEWRRKIVELEQTVEDGEQRRILNRRINFHASHQKVDKQGRINIPAELIQYANLEKDVVVLGTGKKIEIWNPEELNKYLQKAETKYQELSNFLDF
ncbi:MAG: division/cell wall cluster transcriptional repressor MraZ [Calditrichia bacterium]|jgi:MraZ protein